jgi:hypothetical protein
MLMGKTLSGEDYGMLAQVFLRKSQISPRSGTYIHFQKIVYSLRISKRIMSSSNIA